MTVERFQKADNKRSRATKQSLNRPGEMAVPGKQRKETASKPKGAAPVITPSESVAKSYPLFEEKTDLLKGMILAEVLGPPRCRRKR